MRCPNCAAADTRVVDSREAEEGSAIRRRRVCDACGERFTTFERTESARIQVIKRDGARQEFDRRKLTSAIAKAATEDLTADRTSALIDDIEQTIRQSGTSEVSSQRIGEMVLERLAQLHPMSYIRFKIVYDKLQDPDTLLREVDTLLRRRAEARDRLVAEQIALPIAAPAGAAPRARRKR
ncbi:MAG: transcriptional regulator NrdR [Chloroflexota bacterium]|nr:transcriptional regulator NrdR [Chloroflexota bacterium]